VQKVSVDAGFTCPNRDGTKGTDGCTYCNNAGFNPSYCNPEKSISQQIREGIAFHAIRYRRAQQYLVYFQPFSNTYAPLGLLRERYEEALSFPGVVGLVIGTRPDCMNDDTLAYLSELSKQYFIQVEYGIETHHDSTLERINRGHDSSVSIEILRKTHQYGIRTGAHYIFGLPGETVSMMMQEAAIISSLPIDTIKFHQLQLVKGTRMEEEYISDPSDFRAFDLEGYIDFIISFIEQLNPAIVIERFTSEMPPRFLSGNNLGLIRYDEVLRKIEQALEERDSWQGKRYQPIAAS
jgi:uncharacterized protein